MLRAGLPLVGAGILRQVVCVWGGIGSKIMLLEEKAVADFGIMSMKNGVE